MSQGSLHPKIRFLCQNVCSVARVQTDTQTDRQTDTKVNTEDTLSGFQEFFLQPIIKDRSKRSMGAIVYVVKFSAVSLRYVMCANGVS